MRQARGHLAHRGEAIGADHPVGVDLFQLARAGVERRERGVEAAGGDTDLVGAAFISDDRALARRRPLHRPDQALQWIDHLASQQPPGDQEQGNQ